MKPRSEIEKAAKELAYQLYGDGLPEDEVKVIAPFLAKLIAQERAKVWEEAARLLENAKNTQLGESAAKFSMKKHNLLRGVFVSHAAASRKEAEGE